MREIVIVIIFHRDVLKRETVYEYLENPLKLDCIREEGKLREKGCSIVCRNNLLSTYTYIYIYIRDYIYLYKII